MLVKENYLKNETLRPDKIKSISIGERSVIDIYEYYKIFELTGLSPMEYSEAVYAHKKSFSVSISNPPKFFFFSLKHSQKINNRFPLAVKSIVGATRAEFIGKGIDFDSSVFRQIINSTKGGGSIVSSELGMKKSNMFVQLKRLDQGLVSDTLILRFIKIYGGELESEFSNTGRAKSFNALKDTIVRFESVGINFCENFSSQDFNYRSLLEDCKRAG